jgi:hypothetical protein
MRIIVRLAVFLFFCYGAALSADLVRIPATALDTDDGLTGMKVRISIASFLIAPAETTQREFQEVMGYNPSIYQGEDRPVENVSWWEAIRYCNLRSIREGLEPSYNLVSGACDFTRNGYRLPTDVEWEHAYGGPSGVDREKAQSYANIGTRDTKDADLLLKAIRERGTRRVGSFPANRFGLYDMIGNVWEWCSDYFNPVSTPRPVANPAGPLQGVARIIRGGSFISTTGSWARGYRSSMEPDHKSRFTGFRVTRRAGPEVTPVLAGEEFFKPYNVVPAGFETSTGNLASLAGSSGGIKSESEWLERRKTLRAKWAQLLGAPSIKPPVPAARLIETVREQNYTGKLMYLQTEPDSWEKIFIMMPVGISRKPLPVVIVPYYDVDVPAGRNMGGRSFTPIGTRSFAYLAVQQGYIAVAIRWFGESYGERYDEAVANLKMRHPKCTGLGKWVWDAQRLLDYLYTLPEVDREHIGIIGHSLGAKMSLYAAAMDDRISTVVFSEGGIGLSFSNYDDFWYLDGSVRGWERSTDHHELLALIAPRPFLLIAGDSADNDKSWYYVNAVRPVYSLYGKQRNIGLFNHRTGHSPTPEAVRLAVEWLKHFLGAASR